MLNRSESYGRLRPEARPGLLSLCAVMTIQTSSFNSRSLSRSDASRADVEVPTDEAVARTLLPILPEAGRRKRISVLLQGRDAMDKLTAVFGSGWDRAERRAGEVLLVSTIIYDEDPPRTFPVEVGVRKRLLRYYEREDGTRLHVSVNYYVVYNKFSIYSFSLAIHATSAPLIANRVRCKIYCFRWRLAGLACTVCSRCCFRAGRCRHTPRAAGILPAHGKCSAGMVLPAVMSCVRHVLYNLDMV